MSTTSRRWHAVPPAARLALPLLLAGVMTVSGATAAAQTPAEPLGTADTALDLGTVTATSPETELGLGTLRAYASSEDDLTRNDLGAGERYALAQVELLGGVTRSAASDEDGSDPGQTVTLEGVGEVTAGALTASASDAEVRAQVAALDVLFDTARVAGTLGASAPVTATVDDASAAARNGVRLTTFSLTLGDVLGESLLDLQAEAVLNDMASLLAGVEASADELEGSELLSIESLEQVATAEATATSSTADVVCTVTGVRLLGQPVTVNGCEDLEGVLADLDAVLEELLGALPIVGGADGLVTVTAPRSTETIDDTRAGTDFAARAGITGIGIEVAALELVADTVQGLSLTPAAVSVEVAFRAADGGAGGGGHGGCDDDGATLPPPCDGPLRRLGGETRVETALEVSKDSFPAAEVVLLARADLYADALAGAPLAVQEGGPILLTPRDDLNDAVSAEIDRLDPERVVLLGGTAALDESVEAEVRQKGVTVARVGGANRFATAALLAEELGATAASAVIVEGGHASPARGWPDAVSAAPYAAHTGRPILLVTADSVPRETAEALDRQGVTETVVVGGEAAVGVEVFAELEAGGHGPRRVFGQDRYGTSAAVWAEGLAEGMDPAVVWLATGADWPDALVVGPAAAADGHTFLLVDGDELSGSPATRQVLVDNRARIDLARLVGGPESISEAVQADVRDILD